MKTVDLDPDFIRRRSLLLDIDLMAQKDRRNHRTAEMVSWMRRAEPMGEPESLVKAHRESSEGS